MTPATTVTERLLSPKVVAAQDYLRFAESLRTPVCGFDGIKSEPRELTKKEQVVYDAALEVLRLYFSGEHEFAANFGGAIDGDSDGQRQVPVPS